MSDLSLGGVHEFFTEPLADDLMARLSPQWSVIVGGADKPDNIEKSRALVLERRRKFPRTAFGVRWWHERDDKMAANFVRDYGSVEGAADKYAEMFFPLAIAGTWLMAGNEEAASESDPNVFKQTVAVHTAIIRRANAAGIAIGTCCTAMGEPQYGQYELLAPLFRAMQDGRNQAKPVYHVWRPNTYFPHSIGKTPQEMASLHFHLTHRHQREGRRVAALNGLQFPPTAFGEFNTVVSLQENLDGPNNIPGYTAQQWITDLLNSGIDLPFAVYCVGDGLYDDKWKSFTLKPDFIEAMISRLPRLPKTLIETWKEKNVTQPNWQSHNWGKRIDGATARVLNAINVRAEPIETSADVGDLSDRTIITYWDRPFAGTKYTWYKVLYDGQERYVAQVQGLRFEAPAEPEPVPPGSVVLTPAQYQQWQAIAQRQRDASADMEAFIKEVAPALLPGSFQND